MGLTFAMLVLEVRDLRRSIDLYRLLGLDVPDPRPDRPQWARLTGAGYHGRVPPTRTAGPYAAMVDDPDDNVIPLTSDEAALLDEATA
ncbi:MAG: hypothetical protein B7X40_04190 [Cellulomonas sp. 14-74-6]|jgi:hypothetical protein|nr:MAG: hypothetical protein B7X40_04190 [Cellulomonas sp. 14-74-6]